MRVIEVIEYVVSVVVFVCFVGVLLVLAVDVIVDPVQVTTATQAVTMPTESEKIRYLEEMRLKDDDNSRQSVAVMEAKMKVKY